MAACFLGHSISHLSSVVCQKHGVSQDPIPVVSNFQDFFTKSHNGLCEHFLSRTTSQPQNKAIVFPFFPILTCDTLRFNKESASLADSVRIASWRTNSMSDTALPDLMRLQPFTNAL